MDAIKVSSIPHMKLSIREGLLSNASAMPGSLHITPHHLIFRSTVDSTNDEVWISHSILTSVTRAAPSHAGTIHQLILRTRDFNVYELSFERSEEADGIWDSLKDLSTGLAAGGIDALFPFCHQPAPADVKGKGKAGWNIYDPLEEFSRMGVGSRSKAWRFSTINADYSYCPTYPAQIVVPNKISDTTLSYAVKYRSKGRIPGLVYLHWANLGSITRSSQPMVGLKNARSIQDEKLIESIFTSHSQHSTSATSHRIPFTITSHSNSSSSSIDSQAAQIVYGATATNLIIDARPTTNAMANSVKGAGTENMEHYRNCKKAYLGIDNIHVMRSSLAGVDQALRESIVTGHLDRTALRRTNWLKHLTNILDGILVITRTIHLSNSHVLVHCSDGWDRTSQLSSIAQLCLDPYYRTAQGLAVLIEKDWLSYGHKFSDRTGHLCGDKTEFINQSNDTVSAQSSFLASVQKQFSGSSHAFKETCPVFQQFLDCIYQIQRQFPNRFEWNELLLRRLQKEIYAISSGSFLWNSEREREQMNGRSRTMSIWEEVFEAEEHDGKLVLRKEFVNVDYDPKLDDPESRGLDSDQGVLLVEPLNVRWWFELFGREDDEMNGKEIPSKEEDVEDIAIIIEGLGDDVSVSSLSPEKPTTPVAAPVPRTAQPVSRSLASVNSSSSRSSSPSNSSTSNLPSQVQLADAVSSVQKFGWGAWKSVQKGYQEAVTTYRDSPLRPASIDADLTQPYAASPTPIHIVPVTRLIQADNIASNPWEQHTAEAIDPSTSSLNPTLFSSPTVIAPIPVLPNATTPVILRETQSHIGEVKAVEDSGSDPLGVGL